MIDSMVQEFVPAILRTGAMKGEKWWGKLMFKLWRKISSA